MQSSWWDKGNTNILDRCVAHINRARRESDQGARCRALVDALKSIANILSTSELQFNWRNHDHNPGSCAQTIADFEEFFTMHFNSPQHRIALYGTLRRGERNHHVIEEVYGQWLGGTITGVLTTHRGYPYLFWEPGAEKIEVEVLSSQLLPKSLARLDEFEGDDYERIWIPVQTTEGKQICNIYAGKQEKSTAPTHG